MSHYNSFEALPSSVHHILAACVFEQKATCERVDEKQAEILASTTNSAARDTRVMSVREAAKARARTQATESVGLLELHLNGATEV